MKITINTKYKNILPIVESNAKFLKQIFEYAPKNIHISIVADRRQMEDILNRKTMHWEVAVTKNNTIFILDPTTAKDPRINVRNFNKILFHELVHIFYNHLVPSGVPYWLNEGLAYYIAKQKFKKFHYSIAAKRALQYYSKFDINIYHYGPGLTSLLIKYNSLYTLMQAIKIFSHKPHSSDNFYKIFNPLLKKLPPKTS